ncbi:hypothetical protein HTY52_28910 [Cupriavidus taiwanensis]|uniref:hypothetical protein n=1 Tax=Cupriavidus taiwanensis TaxID=164546 RepID=UPI001572F0E2|nr:hypothetical protein [Cupriavidus taiwanensis]NSX18128.1 hypothetical protein [Cupriavidus taiwanensis]
MQNHIEKACRAHTNLSTFEAVVGVLECGSIYGGLGSEKAAQRIIKIVRAEQQRLLTIHDKAVRAIRANDKGE